MKKVFSRLLLSALLLAVACSGHAAKPQGLSEKTYDGTVIEKGSFSQEFLIVTNAHYNQQWGSIFVSGFGSEFSDITLELFTASGQSLTDKIDDKVNGNHRVSQFSDRAFENVDLNPSTTYKLLVSGIATKKDAEFTIRGGFVQSISPVPEPETYSMLLAGLGLIGAIALRRGRQS